MAKKNSEIEENKSETPGSGDVENSDVTAEELGADQVQEKMDEEQERGYRGVKVDKTPNENYTVAGVTKNLPTPETDPELARQAGSPKFVHAEQSKAESERAKKYHESRRKKEGE
jgi:hypothetical protein